MPRVVDPCTQLGVVERHPGLVEMDGPQLFLPSVAVNCKVPLQMRGDVDGERTDGGARDHREEDVAERKVSEQAAAGKKPASTCTIAAKTAAPKTKTAEKSVNVAGFPRAATASKTPMK